MNSSISFSKVVSISCHASRRGLVLDGRVSLDNTLSVQGLPRVEHTQGVPHDQVATSSFKEGGGVV